MTLVEYFQLRKRMDQRLTLSRKEAWELIGCKRTRLDKLRKANAFESYLEGGCRRRICTPSVYDYIIAEIQRGKAVGEGVITVKRQERLARSQARAQALARAHQSRL